MFDVWQIDGKYKIIFQFSIRAIIIHKTLEPHAFCPHRLVKALTDLDRDTSELWEKIFLFSTKQISLRGFVCICEYVCVENEILNKNVAAELK